MTSKKGIKREEKMDFETQFYDHCALSHLKTKFSSQCLIFSEDDKIFIYLSKTIQARILQLEI